MNLIKNVEGEWPAAKGRVRQDLDSIQRAFNAMQADLAALTKQVNTPDPVPAATISAANQVTVPTGDFLSVVAVDGTTVTGDGRPTNPLKSAGGGLTSVATDPAGALSGNGTTGSKLAVKVDGSTVTINGSNQLVASGTAPPLNVVTQSFTAAQFAAMATTPKNFIAGVAGNIIQIVFFSAAWDLSVSFFTSSPTWQGFWTGDVANPVALAAPNMSFVDGYLCTTGVNRNTVTNAPTRYIGKGWDMNLSFAPGNAVNVTASFKITFAYYLMPQP